MKEEQQKMQMPTFNLKNAVLVKDMQVRAKRSNLPALLFIVNMVLSLVATIIMIVINARLVTYSNNSNDHLPWFFIGCIIAESALICLVIPIISSTTIASEREHQTLDVLLTTSMSPFDIVLGKYLSCIAYVAIMLLSTVPALSIASIYGSINFFQMFSILLVMMVMAMFLAAFGVHYSVSLKKSNHAVVMSFVMTGVLLGSTIILVMIAYGIINAIETSFELKYGYTGTPYVTPDPSIFLLYVNPMCTIFDAVGRIVGFKFVDDYSLHTTMSITGMKTVIAEVCPHLSLDNIFVRFWTLFSCITQLVLSWLLLKSAARRLDPSRAKIRHRRTKNAGKQS